MEALLSSAVLKDVLDDVCFDNRWKKKKSIKKSNLRYLVILSPQKRCLKDVPSFGFLGEKNHRDLAALHGLGAGDLVRRLDRMDAMLQATANQLGLDFGHMLV